MHSKSLISFATAWGPQWGGINAFNMDLLIAVAAAFAHDVNVVCVVLDADSNTRDKALDRGVTLVSLDRADEKTMEDTLEASAWMALQTALPNLQPHSDTIWLGHDRITGAIALKAAQTRSGQSALIHHMSYQYYESYAENSASAESKVHEQMTLFKAANHRLAIGPLLKEALEDLIDSDQVRELTPGLAGIEPRSRAPHQFKVFLSGRLNADSAKLKQAWLGLAGFAHAVKACDEDKGYPDALRSEQEPQLRLRGLNWDEKEPNAATGIEQEIRAFVQTHAGRQLSLSLLPFTHDRDALFEELRGTSAALMPSWHEGFGLVAWEAIAAGVPLVLSQKSGVYRLLKAMGLENHVLPINPQATADEPFFADADKEAVADALIQIAKAPATWRTNAARLRETLLRNNTWQNCAQQLLSVWGWQTSIAEVSITVPTHVIPANEPARTATHPALPNLLELPSPRWQAHAGLSPSQLLRAEEALVPFDPARQPFLQTQIDWAQNDQRPLTVRLLTGPGGCGKTRLALQLCQDLSAQGWLAGFLPSGLENVAHNLVQHTQQGRSVLVVVDYAETRQIDVLKLLAHCQSQRVGQVNTTPLRVLLLARSGGDWWQQLPSIRSDCESLLLGAASGPYNLPELHTDLTQRAQAYTTALGCYAQQLQRTPPQHRPDLSLPHFVHPLPLQMAALLALHGEAHDTTSALTRAIVAHEQRYWTQATSHSTSTPTAPQAASLLMTLATLAGQINTAKDIEPVWLAMGQPREALRPLWSVLQPLYPGSQGLQGLRPDLLGETLVAQGLLATSGAELLHALLTHKRQEWTAQTLTVLARVLRHRDDIAPTAQVALQTHYPALAHTLCDTLVATPSPQLSHIAITAYENLPRAIRHQVAGLIAPRCAHDILALNALGLAVDKHRFQEAQAKWNKTPSFANQKNYAHACNTLALSWDRTGQTQQALSASEKALDVWQQLIRKPSVEIEEGLATALLNHATYLAQVGRSEEALSVSGKALEKNAQLTQKYEKRFTSDWAMSLSNHANRLADVGQHDEALRLSQQALDIHKNLAYKQSDVHFISDWALSLNNHAVRLADVGQHDEALKLSQQALDIHQKLADSHPERFTSNWVASLNNHAVRLADVGQHDEALKLSQQALDSYQKLAKQQSERFAPDWAMSLGSHAMRLADAGDISVALKNATEACTLYAKLASDAPLLYQASYATSTLQTALLAWLCQTDHTVSLPELETQTCLEREQRKVTFFESCLVCVFTCEKQFDAALAHACKKAWIALDLMQQNDGEDLMLLVCVVLHAKGMPPLKDDWQAQLARWHARRKGHVPVWMKLCAMRVGVMWPQ